MEEVNERGDGGLLTFDTGVGMLNEWMGLVMFNEEEWALVNVRAYSLAIALSGWCLLPKPHS